VSKELFKRRFDPPRQWILDLADFNARASTQIIFRLKHYEAMTIAER
jgi:hypothetical protein